MLLEMETRPTWWWRRELKRERSALGHDPESFFYILKAREGGVEMEICFRVHTSTHFCIICLHSSKISVNNIASSNGASEEKFGNFRVLKLSIR